MYCAQIVLAQTTVTKQQELHFKNPKLLAKILQLDEALLSNINILLIAVSTQLPIYPIKFDQLCNKTANIYVEKYGNIPMTVTIHKLLLHGAQIITHSILPVGMVSEEASAGKNKNYKEDRIRHARKDFRIYNILDVFNRSMDTSDPILSAEN